MGVYIKNTSKELFDLSMQLAGYEVESIEVDDPPMMLMARAIKEKCMQYPRYSDCLQCECFDEFEGACKIGEPAGWQIDEEETEE